MQESSRIESCHIALAPDEEGSPDSPPPAVLSALENAFFPLLNRLYLRKDTPEAPIMILPSSSFQGDLSRLNELYLTDIWFDLVQLNVNLNLQYLSVQLRRAKDVRIPSSMSRWLPILETLLNLTNLGLHIPQWPNQEALPIERGALRHVTLQHLVRVTLSLTTTDLKTFLEFVSIPACLNLVLTLHVTAWEDIHTYTKALVQRYAKPPPPGQGDPELVIFNSVESCTFGFGFLRDPYPPPPPPHHPNRPPFSDQPLTYQDLGIRLVRYSVQIPEEHLEETFRSFASAWDSIVKGIATITVPGTQEMRGSMPNDFIEPIREMIAMGRSDGGCLKRVVCAENYTDVLASEEPNGQYGSVSKPLEIIPIPTPMPIMESDGRLL